MARGDIDRQIAGLPGVQAEVGLAAHRLARAARAVGAQHGSIGRRIQVENAGKFDSRVVYEKYDEKGRGVGGPLELGHVLQPYTDATGDFTWIPGIHVFRYAIIRTSVVV